MTELETAIQIALVAHAGQVDKAGEPYILHPIRIMNKMDTIPEKIIAILHDVLEDTDKDINFLQTNGIHTGLGILAKLTRLPGESYSCYIDEVSLSSGKSGAPVIKLADLEDNMNILRLKKPNKEDFNRLKKYHKAWNTITNHLNKE